jgi:hypothetical protein
VHQKVIPKSCWPRFTVSITSSGWANATLLQKLRLVLHANSFDQMITHYPPFFTFPPLIPPDHGVSNPNDGHIIYNPCLGRRWRWPWRNQHLPCFPSDQSVMSTKSSFHRNPLWGGQQHIPTPHLPPKQ